MSKQLDNDQDVKQSLDSMESDGKTLKIKEGRTPVYILDSTYEDGYIHWIGGKRIVCAGGLEGRGWAPDVCACCKKVEAAFKKAKQLEGKSKKAAEKTRGTARGARAKYEAQFLAAVGELVVMKDPKTGNKRKVPDFDEARVGILPFTAKQFEDFTGLRSNENFPQIEGPEDLLNRVIILDKKKRGESKYPTIEYIPAKSPSDPPEIEYDRDEFDLAESFIIDEEAVINGAKLFDAPAVRTEDVDSNDDEEENVDNYEADEDDFDEDDIDTEDDVDDDFLDDVLDEDEDDPPVKKLKPKVITKSKSRSTIRTR